MRFWFDADNPPHVLVMRPIAKELEERGHEVLFTARDRRSTCELLDMYGTSCTIVGREHHDSTLGRVFGTLGRAWQLRGTAKSWNMDVSFGHGSRALPIASRMLGIPSVTMYDYEWVNPTIFNRFCSKILLPEVIDEQRCREAGIDYRKVRHFPGFKEQLYLKDARPDPEIARELGLKPERKKILLRPPATMAHYHDPETERIMNQLLETLLRDESVQLVIVPRNDSQRSLVSGTHEADVVYTRRQYDDPSLILCCDAVIGGGGTMTREAAILGVPSYTFFRGREGAVDRALKQAGHLSDIRESNPLEHPLECSQSARFPDAYPVKAIAEALLSLSRAKPKTG